MSHPEDPNWPRAAHWLARQDPAAKLAVLGVPAHQTSISPTSADQTPKAVREALLRYSTYHLDLDVDLAALPAIDLGDVADPDHADGEARVAAAVSGLRPDQALFAIGGDNSITYSVMSGLFGGGLAAAGLITLDAHFDLRDGISNGSPVRRLIESGLDPRRVVQIGINNFSNSAWYAARARDLGITVVTRSELEERGIRDVMEDALEIAAGPSGIYVDLDADVCDRAFVPACPAAAPGGITPAELRLAAQLAGLDPRVRAIDVTEIDSTRDAADGRTVRLAALCLLEFAAGRATWWGNGEA